METKKRQRNIYTPEFKKEAVERSRIVGVTKAKDELGVSLAALSRWRKEFSGEASILNSTRPSYEELEKENRRLKKELGYVEEINKVLKKSTAIFSSSQLGGLK